MGGDKFIIPRRFRLALKRLNVQNFLKFESGRCGPFCAGCFGGKPSMVLFVAPADRAAGVAGCDWLDAH